MRIIFLLLLSSCLHAQKSFERTKVEVLESYQTSYRNFWTGETQSIKISLIQRSDSTSRIATVNFEVFSKDVTTVGAASSIALTSGLNFAFGSTSFQNIERKNGLIALNKTDFFRLIDFFNESIARKATEKPAYETSWQLTIDHRFLVALVYRPNDQSKWFYCLGIDGAAFEISSEEALSLMQKLGAMKKKLLEN